LSRKTFEFRVSGEFRTGENTPLQETCQSPFAFYGWQMRLSLTNEWLIDGHYIGQLKNAY
jgi:hypothetical protein